MGPTADRRGRGGRRLAAIAAALALTSAGATARAGGEGRASTEGAEATGAPATAPAVAAPAVAAPAATAPAVAAPAATALAVAAPAATAPAVAVAIAPPAAASSVEAPAVPSPARRLAAAGAAVVPGLLLHGSGHLVIGDWRTARRLMAWQGVAMASFLGGIAGLALTGAAPRTVPIFIPLTAAGAGLFGTTWLADVHGVTMPPGARGESRRAPPRIEAEAGMRYVHDRVLPYRAFLVAALDWRLGGFRLAPSAWVAVDHGNARLRAAGAYRLAGPRPRAADAGPAPPAAADGSYLDLEVALTHHRYGSERFALTLGEAALAGRLDLARIAASLAGSFAEVGVGLAFGGITYFDVTTEATDLLLGRFAWGLYLGREADRWAELSIYYDHRHDGFAGGLKLPGLGSGSAGHFGARALAYLGPRWGFLVDLQAGSAYVAGASVMLRHGGGA